jgi:spore maturation protein CgeB
MRIVIFGLTVSSAWGNSHAALWRSLIRGLDRNGHQVTFFERDVPYYRAHRDLPRLAGGAKLRLYASWDDVRAEAARATSECDAAIVTSYCPDGRAACEVVLESRADRRVFYDLDTPVTLTRLATGEDVPYIPANGLGDFDLVLSFTGGRALELLRERLGARAVAPLYASVDPSVLRPVPPDPKWSAACSYLGTWSDDRHAALDTLFLAPARRQPEQLFVLGGSMLPTDVAWPANVARFDHVPPTAHPAFYCSSPLTVSVTRRPMVELGYCPSGRLFEAAACSVPVLSDWWEGLDTFFTPGEEILVASNTDEAIGAVTLPRGELAAIGQRARQRALADHSATRRAAELVAHLRASP